MLFAEIDDSGVSLSMSFCNAQIVASRVSIASAGFLKAAGRLLAPSSMTRLRVRANFAKGVSTSKC